MTPLVLPFISVVLDAIYLTVSKAFFNRYHKITSREFNWLQFAGILFVFMMVLPFFGVWPTHISTTTGLLLFAVGALGTISNVLYFWGLDHEKISEIEPFLLFNPLITILIASLFYTDERSWPIYIAVFVASMILSWAHLKKLHLNFTMGVVAILGFSLAYGLEAVVIKALLADIAPVTLYFFRCLMVFIGLSIFSKPNLKIVKKHHLAPFGILGAIAVASVAAAYTSYQLRGLSATVIVFTLSPILVYILSIIFLKEKWKSKNVVASVLITALVIWVNLVK